MQSADSRATSLETPSQTPRTAFNRGALQPGRLMRKRSHHICPRPQVRRMGEPGRLQKPCPALPPRARRPAAGPAALVEAGLGKESQAALCPLV